MAPGTARRPASWRPRSWFRTGRHVPATSGLGHAGPKTPPSILCCRDRRLTGFAVARSSAQPLARAEAQAGSWQGPAEAPGKRLGAPWTRVAGTAPSGVRSGVAAGVFSVSPAPPAAAWASGGTSAPAADACGLLAQVRGLLLQQDRLLQAAPVARPGIAWQTCALTR